MGTHGAPSDPLRPGPRGHSGPEGLADVLERVLDKGLVVAGDVQLHLLDIEVLTLKIRLLVASADTAQQMGIDWWKHDPFLSGKQRELEEENRDLRQRLQRQSNGAEGEEANASERDEDGQEESEDLQRRLARLEEVVAQGLGPAAHGQAESQQRSDTDEEAASQGDGASEPSQEGDADDER